MSKDEGVNQVKQSNKLRKSGVETSKKLLLSTMTALMLTLPLSQAAFAVSDEEATSAAQKGTEYLEANQNDDGGIKYDEQSPSSSVSSTAWAVIAVETTGKDAGSVESGTGNSVIDFLENDKPTEATSTTDIERSILAIKAAGKDSKVFGGVDYNQALEDRHNNNQLGDPSLLNDDYFGVLAVEASGDASITYMAQDALNYFLDYQNQDGGFSWKAFCTQNDGEWCSTASDGNDTSAAIQALYAAERMGLINITLVSFRDKAIEYLKKTQKPDGCFGYDEFSPSDGSSTAWGLMTLNVIGQSVADRANAARSCLLRFQNKDCGFTFGAYGATESDSYTTAHAMIALSGSSWSLIPNPFTSNKRATCVEPTVDASDVESQSPAISKRSNTDLFSPPVFAADSGTNGIKNNGDRAAGNEKNSSKSVLKSEDKNWLFVGGPLALVLVAFAWYLLQSRGKKTGEV